MTEMTGNPYEDHGSFYLALTGNLRLEHHASEVGGLIFKLVPDTYRYPANGPVSLVDLCCGNGVSLAHMLRSPLGGHWQATGVDQSRRMLEAAEREGLYKELIHARAYQTGLPSGGFDLVTCIYAWTDVGQWDLLAREARRIVRHGGYFLAVGAHPEFSGPDAIRNPDGSVVIAAHGYARSRFVTRGLGFTAGGWRERAGCWHRPMPQLLAPFLGASPWRLQHMAINGGDPPSLFGFVAQAI